MILVYSTFPDEESAVKVGNALLEERLIACFNAFEIKSGYWWEGKITHDDEWAVIFKTKESLIDEVFEKIKDLHPYTTPAIFAIPVLKVDEDYKEWLEKETK